LRAGVLLAPVVSRELPVAIYFALLSTVAGVLTSSGRRSIPSAGNAGRKLL
jgi:hypothetical protein